MRLVLALMFGLSLSAQASLYDSIESVDTLRVLADAQNSKLKDSSRKIATDENSQKSVESKKEEKN